jgi:hypothetical protein
LPKHPETGQSEKFKQPSFENIKARFGLILQELCLP